MEFLPNPRFNFSLSLSLAFFFLLIQISLQSDPSIYDHLLERGLPAGILPKGVTDFSIDPKTGSFTVNLTRPCNVQFENQFHYDLNISGVIGDGEIRELSGVTQQELFLWLPVKRVRVDVPSSGLIHFDVGVVDKHFSLSNFECPPDCIAVDPDPTQSDEPKYDSGYAQRAAT